MNSNGFCCGCPERTKRLSKRCTRPLNESCSRLYCWWSSAGIWQEILQEAYVRIWLNAATYRSTMGSPMMWMITIARNLAIDVARKPTLEVYSDHTVMLNFPAEIPTALENIETRESENETIKLRDSIFSALQALEPSRRQLVVAAYIHGESRHRLSELYGVPVNTIKTWIRRALLEVRAQIGAMPASHNDFDLLTSTVGYQCMLTLSRKTAIEQI